MSSIFESEIITSFTIVVIDNVVVIVVVIKVVIFFVVVVIVVIVVVVVVVTVVSSNLSYFAKFKCPWTFKAKRTSSLFRCNDGA